MRYLFEEIKESTNNEEQTKNVDEASKNPTLQVELITVFKSFVRKNVE